MRGSERVTQEIEALHAFFVAWFNGTVPETSTYFEAGLGQRLDADFTLIQPSGKLLGGKSIVHGIRASYGRSQGFRIAIRDVRVLRQMNDVVLAVYQEWQINARAAGPANNGRLSSVAFRDDGDCLRWLHVHETWLPEPEMTVGPYDF